MSGFEKIKIKYSEYIIIEELEASIFEVNILKWKLQFVQNEQKNTFIRTSSNIFHNPKYDMYLESKFS